MSTGNTLAALSRWSQPKNDPVAVWQCPNCQRVQTLTFYGGISTCTINRLCGCTVLSESGYTSLRVTFQLQPLNDLARAVDEQDAQIEAQRIDARRCWKEMLAGWPPAPCDRWTWEAR